ncbi:nitrate reductase [Comamonas endophytica]|uniref:Molybdopterin-dependent oxidoreductase n=1 Tax=Comamonas endophytica TaxID=2949090 RepID=A0ABY6G8L3_9BURK|nr:MULTISPECIES: nitrate reductase [unclassified Acidovorax]MCD2514230.1 molybdopterin-dependent oxidoreductase [Acidovorax sp. D4N7]UYG51369.1 molybdopterin-dependent oxidoreductase [Acidovorax sp. 5MLIR]
MSALPVTHTRSTCPYCGVGCGVVIEAQGGRITGVQGDPLHPANFGKLCTKGSTLHLTATAEVTRQARLLQPMQRLERGAAPVPVSWDAALDTASSEIARIVTDHGPDAVGFYLSGQLLTEDYYAFNKLAKGLLGTNNLDTNSRLCMSSAVAGYKATLGADAPPACYEDIERAHCVFIVGSNMAWAHPILFRRLEAAKAANPAMKIIVADPRRTDTASLADLFLPIAPGSDVLLFHGMLHLMLWEGWIDSDYIAAHTTGFEALKNLVRSATPERVAQECGVRVDDVLQATRWFAQSPASLSLYCQGLNQSSSGTAKNAALINLHLATGQIGKPGAGPLSLTGQPNAMGGREVGGMANLLSGHRDLANATHRAEVAALWGIPEVPAAPGKTAIEMFEAAADGQIKALWIACTNPAQSMPDQRMVQRALERAELVVVQEAFTTTETARHAHLLLPASSWGEKIGTVTNSERRISRVRAAVPAPGMARHDWQIAVELAHRLEARLRPGQRTLFPYAGPQALWEEHRSSTAGRDLDITGLSWERLEQGPQQWPMPEGASQGQARLYENGIFPTPDGKARFHSASYQPLAEPVDARYPFGLTTGRLRDQWHGMSRTGTLGRLFSHTAEPRLHMHPQDMQRRGFAEGELVQIASRRGTLMVPVQADTQLAPTRLFMAMHWGSEFLGGRAENGERLLGINALTQPAFCPTSKQPELKHTAVKVSKVELPWSLLAMAWLPAESVLEARQSLAALMGEFDFATCAPFGSQVPLSAAARTRTGVLLRAAAHQPPAPEVLQQIEQLLGLSGAHAIRYEDKRRQQSRTLQLQPLDQGALRLEVLLLTGDTRAGSWLAQLLADELPLPQPTHLLLTQSAHPPSGAAPRSAQVCSCMNVNADRIGQTLAQCAGCDGERLAQLQQRLGCGTQCGSCIPELKRLVQAIPVAALPETTNA